jgi:hypothetical protein
MRVASERPATTGQTAAPIVDQIERAHPANVFSEPAANFNATFGYFCVAILSETNEVVILRYDLATGAGEVQRDGGHIAAEVFRREWQLRWSLWWNSQRF